MCKYCEGSNLDREDLMYTGNGDAVCIWNNNLLIDEGEFEDTECAINYCPMCGRKLEG